MQLYRALGGLVAFEPAAAGLRHSRGPHPKRRNTSTPYGDTKYTEIVNNSYADRAPGRSAALYRDAATGSRRRRSEVLPEKPADSGSSKSFVPTASLAHLPTCTFSTSEPVQARRAVLL